MRPPLSATNDFVVKFANVNGSGSASANQLFARSILRMGVPIASRNIFPSNIQGLPTWFEVRVSGEGYLGRRGGVDLMVAMNPQTWDRDLAEIEPGGYLLYDSTKPLPLSRFREDINDHRRAAHRALQRGLHRSAAAAAPEEHHLCGRALRPARHRAGRPWRRCSAEQFKGKDKLVKANGDAFHMGRDWALENLSCPLGLRVERRDAVGNRIYVDGNSAAGLGAVYGGATVCAWYPITPSTSLAEGFERYCRRFRVDPDTGEKRYAIVQAEDELASIGMVIGAAWNGARAFTATSGPGISLMQEFIGLSYFAEIPSVIFDVQRAGPSTGMPTRTQQSDVLAAAYASHGDTKHIVLFPEDPRECFEMAARAFDLADRFQTPVFVLLDLDIGMNEWLCDPFAWDDGRRMDRGKVVTAEELEAGRAFGRYLDVDGDGIAYRTYPGTHPSKGAFFTRGTSRDRYAKYTEQGPAYVDNMERLLRKFETAKSHVPRPMPHRARDSARLGVIHYGSTAAAMREALDLLQQEGVQVDALRIRAFPFHNDIAAFIAEPREGLRRGAEPRRAAPHPPR